MSGKTKVYQGVRVKTTVKELLQRLRAREANSKKLKPVQIGQISQGCLDLQELCQSTSPNFLLPARYVDPPPPVAPSDASSCGGSRALQLRTGPFQLPDSSCSLQMQGDAFGDSLPHAGDMTLSGDCYAVVNNNNNNIIIGGSGYDPSQPPLHTFPLPWYYGLSPEADYYGHAMANGSPPESRKLCSPADHSSYSPQDSFSSSSSSSCYDSPTRMESSHNGFASEHCHYQNCDLQDCYCLPSCRPGQQEILSAPEYTPYYAPTDYPYACQVEENYFMRDLQIPEMCYNVL